MRIGVTIFGSEVSPLFDSAQRLLVADVERGKVETRPEVSLRALDLGRRVDTLAKLGVRVLVCGAISGFVRRALVDRGIQVFAWVSGTSEEVLALLAARYEPAKTRRGAVVAVSSNGPRTSADVVPCLGRADHLLIVKLDDLSVAHASVNGPNGGGALRAARAMIAEGADVLLTAGCGPNARGVFTAAGVQVVLASARTVVEAVERFKHPEEE